MISASARRLSVFKAVADHGGFNLAADRLGIAQPSVGAHIRALERQVGQPLFHRRRGQRSQLTKAGETLYAIARLYRIGVMDIVALNNLSLQEGIRPGQALKLPSPHGGGDDIAKEDKPEAEKQLMHEVKTSDTLYSIARQYNVTIKEIMEWNQKKDFSLTVGEKLKIMRAQ